MAKEKKKKKKKEIQKKFKNPHGTLCSFSSN